MSVCFPLYHPFVFFARILDKTIPMWLRGQFTSIWLRVLWQVIDIQPLCSRSSQWIDVKYFFRLTFFNDSRNSIIYIKDETNICVLDHVIVKGIEFLCVQEQTAVMNGLQHQFAPHNASSYKSLRWNWTTIALGVKSSVSVCGSERLQLMWLESQPAG